MGVPTYILAAALIGAATLAAAEPVMVIDARGPSATRFPRGTMLDSAFSAMLQPSDRLIVVDRKGTRVFSGPGRVTIDREVDAPSRWDDIRTMIARSRDHVKRRGRMKTGVVRGGFPSERVIEMPTGPREGLATIEWPDAQGHYCFDADAGLVISRMPNANGTPYPAANFEFSGIDSRASEGIDIAEGRPLFLWPETALPGEGETAGYRVASGGRGVAITLSAVDADDLDPLALAQVLTEKQCRFSLSMFADKADQLEAE